MLVGDQMKLHERCIDVLEMIRRCNNEINDYKRMLNAWDKAEIWDGIRASWSRDEIVYHMERFRAINRRLSMWYADISIRLQEEVYYRLSLENK